MGRKRGRAGAVLLGALWLAPAVPAAAAGVDGAGRIVIVPLVVTGDERESLVTLTNAGSEWVRVSGIYVGVEGTVRAASIAGPIACDPQEIPRDGSVTLPLRTLCPGAHSQDGENMGYLELVSDADARANFFATSVTDTKSGASFGVPGQPVGAYDPGRMGATEGLEVAGLRTRSVQAEMLFCYLASLDEKKKVDVELRDGKGNPMASATTFALDPRRMVRFEVPSTVGLPPADRDELRVAISSGDGAMVIAGCGPVRNATSVLAYQPAQAAVPADRARLRSVSVNSGLKEGPFTIAAVWQNVALGGGANSKVALSTYLRSDDEVRCRVVPYANQPNNYDTTPWVDIQIKDPTGSRVGGGTGAKDTGVVHTPSSGTFGPGTTQRYQIEVGFDNSATAGWPWGVPAGGWQIQCESASGMSEPVALPIAFHDDF
ncbi:MAG: hypothetical protein ABW221_22565 [Vicinamibacteria bacterium]